MVKRIISIVLAAAVIAGFAAVCSAAAYKTNKITDTAFFIILYIN